MHYQLIFDWLHNALDFIVDRETFIRKMREVSSLDKRNSAMVVKNQASTKHLKNTKLYSLEFLRTEMTSDLSNRNREYEPYGEYSLL